MYQSKKPYLYGTGRRKSSVARVHLFPNGTGSITINGRDIDEYYRTHSGWVGGLKETKYRILMQDKPELAMRVAVRGMMPRNIVTKDSLKRLHIYAGEQHDHAAQKPELVK